jgi:L,D-transpeptidase YcbB
MAVFAMMAAGSGIAWAADLATALRAEIAAAQAVPRSVQDERVSRLYEARGFAPLWLSRESPHVPSARALQLQQRLAQSSGKGLEPARYDPGGLAEELAGASSQPTSAAALARLDLRLTRTLLDYLTHLSIGRVDPVSVQFHVAPTGREGRLEAALHAAVDDGVEAAEVQVEPRLQVYRRLLALLQHYRHLHAQFEAEPVPTLPPLARGRVIADGDRYEGVAVLTERLRRVGDFGDFGDYGDPGDLANPGAEPASGAVSTGPDSASSSASPASPASSAPPIYDARLAEALRRFQARHGLQPDGVLGPLTLEALNVPPSTRVRQIELALERIRWLPEPAAGPFVAVNIPDFRLWAVDTIGPAAPSAPLTMRVIVGKAGTRSEVFVDSIRAVEFNPFWNVPTSIASRELYPKLSKDSGWLAREQMELIGGAGLSGSDLRAALASGKARLRQRPGPDNALGRIKFVMPNRYSIYLHDTPSRLLFERSRRDFSHGCIRLEYPAALAAFLLSGEPAWTPEAIGAAIDAGTNRTVRLRRPVPVLIFYSTVHAEPDGSARFVADIYGHDARLDAALRKVGRR